MSLQHSIKHLSAIALIGLVWGCNTSKQAIVSKSSSGEVYDDLYASTSDVRPATLGGRIYNEQGYDESTYQAPVYRNGSSTNNSAQGTNEYYSQNWLNSRSVYQNQDDYSAGYNNGYSNGFANGLNNGYGNYGLNNWYSNPAISFGLGYSRWSPFGYSSMGYYDPFYSNFNDPYWGWSSSRWMYGNSFGYGYSPYGYNGFYSPYGYGSSLAYGGYYSGYYNNYNNYVGSVIGAETPAKYRSRPAYASSAYNSDFNNNRGAAYNRGSRTNADYSNTNSDYYSRPRRDGSSANYNTGTTTNSSRSTNSNYSNGRNNSWDWSSNNNNSRTTNTTTNSTWNNSSSGSSSSGSSGGGGGGGRSRGPR